MLTIEGIAKVCHEANRAYCETLGDTSQPKWEDAPEWQRESAVDGVVFHKQNAHARPSASHENWMAQKEADGWRYGEFKDPEAKTHPCMVPFGELPVSQQRKDYLFKFICDALLPMYTVPPAEGTEVPHFETFGGVGGTLALVNGADMIIARDAAFSVEGPGANFVTNRPVMPAAARVPLFHGKYEVDCEAPSGDQPPLTRVTVTGTHGADGVPFPEPKFIAEVVMDTKSPAPELVFREKVGSVQRLEEATAG